MKKDVKCYLGMNLSKLWVDITLMRVVDHHRQPTTTERFDNTEAGIKVMDKWLRKQEVPFDDNSLLVVENTGVYHRLIGNATHIKHSAGIATGKNDKLDSRRLCSYTFKNREELKAMPALNPVLLQLKDLSTALIRLLTQLNSIKQYLGERNCPTRKRCSRHSNGFMPLLCKALKHL